MQSSEKPKAFCYFFMAFLEFTLNLKHFEEKKKKKILIAKVFMKLLTPNDAATQMHEMSCFYSVSRVNA